MTYYLKESEWYQSVVVPEGMNLDMLAMPGRLDTLLKPALEQVAANNIIVDLGCGTGVLGLHALSKGATFVYFIERDPQMFHILTNVLPNKISGSNYKLINKDIESLCIDDFDCGLPDVVISEFYGPRLFDEGYVNYTKHLRSFLPKCQFIPETFKVDFYLNDIDYTQSIWPSQSELVDHFKFMYKEKGFAKHIDIDCSECLGSITFNANTQQFDNSVEFNYKIDSEKLLIGKAIIEHKNFTQYYTVIGWVMDSTDINKTFRVYYDVEQYFNPRKVEI
jgi:predicted RNA methylase